MTIVDIIGEQLTVAGASGAFEFVTEDWWPHEDGLTRLQFPPGVEQENIKVGPGDWIVGPQSWSPTVVQITMYLFGESRADREALLQSWREELCEQGSMARTATYDTAGGLELVGSISGVKVSPAGRLRPGGWPFVVEFTIHAPFVEVP